MKNILDIQATASYIKACASQADLKVEYKGVRQPHVSGSSIVIPSMTSVATERDLIKLRSFVAETVASKLYSGTALQDAGINLTNKNENRRWTNDRAGCHSACCTQPYQKVDGDPLLKKWHHERGVEETNI